VLTACEALLERIAAMGMMNAIESAAFADVSRAPEGGRGFDGVFERAPDYWNPFEEPLRYAVAQPALSGVEG
jgi:beta-lysine 5,6-aminomutase alpha subunit